MKQSHFYPDIMKLLKRFYLKGPKPHRVLFYRDFRGYSGGHQKVFDYFSHLKSTEDFLPNISFSKATLWDETSPWYSDHQFSEIAFAPRKYDYLFLAGMDWAQLRDSFSRPIINLVQHVRHADPTQDVYPFLTRKAIRICVSPEVEQAIRSTGKVNGPTFTISNGANIPARPLERVRDFYLLGGKQPELALIIGARLEEMGYSVKTDHFYVSRKDMLESMATSRISCVLPKLTEGFYLPALESMALSDLTIVPDCVGNRSFCIGNVNCLLTTFDLEDILDNCIQGMSLLKEPATIDRIKGEARRTVSKHSLEAERSKFLEIMRNIPQIW